MAIQAKIARNDEWKERMQTEIQSVKTHCEQRTANYAEVQAAMRYLMKNQDEMRNDIKELSKKLDQYLLSHHDIESRL